MQLLLLWLTPLTDAHPVPEQMSPSGQSSQFLLSHMMSYGMKYLFGHFEPAVLSLSPPRFLCTPSLPTDRAAQEAEKSLD